MTLGAFFDLKIEIRYCESASLLAFVPRGQAVKMHPDFLEALVQELSPHWIDDLPEWIPCMDSDLLQSLPTKAARLRWLRKAKAEITRRQIQERVDEIAEAWDCEDEMMIRVLLEAFPKDLEIHKILTPAQRQMWIDKASLAACGRSNESVIREPIIYFIAAGELVKIGHTTNLRSRLRSLRTASPSELRVLLTRSGTRDDECELHRRFAEFRVSREWFKLCDPINQFISANSNSSDEMALFDD
jgi:hypothetical protein